MPYTVIEQLLGVPEAEQRAENAKVETGAMRDKYNRWAYNFYNRGRGLKLPDNPLTTPHVFTRQEFAPGYNAANTPALQQWIKTPIKQPQVHHTSESFDQLPGDKTKKVASYVEFKKQASLGDLSKNPFAAAGLGALDMLQKGVEKVKGAVDKVVHPVDSISDVIVDKVTGGADETQRRQDTLNEIRQNDTQQPAAGDTSLTDTPYFRGALEGLNSFMHPTEDFNAEAAGKLDPNIFNSDAFRNLKTNEEKFDYLQQMAAKAGVINTLSGMKSDIEAGNMGWQDILDIVTHPSKLYEIPQQVLDEPEFFQSILFAVDRGDMDALEFLQWVENKWNGKGASGAGGNAGAGIQLKFSEDQVKQIKDTAQKVLWREIQKNPLANIPKAIAMFFRMQGWDQMADFARDPFKFYLSLAGILLGGSMFLGGDDDDERQPINSGSQLDPRMARVPYSYQQRLA